MPYIKDGAEYLDAREMRVYQAVRQLNADRRATNNSQLAAATRLSRTTTAGITASLRRRGFLRDASRPGTAAYHWRITDKPAMTEPPS
jgi:DNA-binding IclR family transcriptional regulator